MVCRILFFCVFVTPVVSLNARSVSKRLSGPSGRLPVEGTPNCNEFKSDQAVLQTFAFPIAIDRVYPSPAQSYAQTDGKGRIISINVVNAKDIPSTLFCVSGLKFLFIHRSTFRNNDFGLPAAIDRLASSLIELHRTGLIHLPESMGALSSLRILSLSSNDISSLPTWMRQVTSVTHLTLSNNPRLTSLEPINGHPSLIVLIVNNCSIKQIPQNLPKLGSLFLSNNDLTDLRGVETLSTTTETDVRFYFDSNHITTIPREIRLVNNLVELNLNGNALFYLPDELTRLPSLTKLHLKGNTNIYWEVVELKSRTRINLPKLRIFS